jgi:hypothetical protein
MQEEKQTKALIAGRGAVVSNPAAKKEKGKRKEKSNEIRSSLDHSLRFVES